jgi:hypothetical protein
MAVRLPIAAIVAARRASPLEETDMPHAAIRLATAYTFLAVSTASVAADGPRDKMEGRGDGGILSNRAC